MCAPRKALIDLLQTEFQKDTKLANEYKSSARKAVQSGLTTRFFDQFPCLISKDALTLLVHELRRIIVCIDPESIVEKNNTYVLLDENDKTDIFEWQMKIISLAAETLLDEKSQINSELLELLQLNHMKIDSWEVLCAFVAQINQHILLQFEKQFKTLRMDNSFVFNMVFYHVNKKYGKWIKVFLQLNNDISDADFENDAKIFKNIILKLYLSSRKISCLKEDDKKHIHQWQTSILRDIMQKILDEEGEVNREFLKLQGLEDIKISPEEFIYIYLDILNTHIVESQKTFFEKYENITKFITDHIKIHKGTWIKDELPNAGYVLISPKMDFAKSNNISPSVLLVLGAAIAAGSAGYMFFKNAREANKPEAEKHKILTV